MNGMGCKCAAKYEGECCCDGVDWTPSVYYADSDTATLERTLRGLSLRNQVARLWSELRAAKKQLHEHSMRDGDMRDAVSDFLCSGSEQEKAYLRTVFERQLNETD